MFTPDTKRTVTSAMIGSVFTTAIDHVHAPGNTLKCADCGEKMIFESTLDGFRKIIKCEGLSSLWKGLSISIALQLPASVCYYALYEKFKKEISQSSNIPKDYIPLFAGSLSRSITTSITSPLEYLRTSIQASAKNQKEADLSLSALRREGFGKLWRGLTPTLMRDVPFSAIYWGTYEYTKSLTSHLDHNNFVKNFSCGYVAGILAASLTCPIDVVKTRMQSSHNLDANNYLTTIGSIQTIYREHGVKGFVKGMGPRLARVGPSGALMISVYELSKRYMIEH